MWPLFLIGGAVIVGGWLWGASKVASNAPPLAHDTFTASGKIQVGDVVEVALLSTEPSATEQIVDVPVITLPPPNLSSEDMVKIRAVDSLAIAGGTGKFLVTAANLLGTREENMGKPISIGVVVDPALSVRVPFFFLNASVRSITRNGKRVG